MAAPIKLKIQLRNAPLKIIRKVLVPDDISMYDLHLIIQKAMGWHNYHLYEFSDKRRQPQIRVGIPNDMDDDFDFWGAELQDAQKVSLKESFLIQNSAKPFFYEYDFGDGWEHRITFQKVSQKQKDAFDGNPLCLEAQGKCPPEDIGGVWGYAEFLETVKDSKNPERKEMLEWLGYDSKHIYDEHYTNLNTINSLLKNF